MTKVTKLSNVSNAAATIIEAGAPYHVSVTVQGTAPILFHRWNCDAVDAKSKAAKGSKAKKSDDIETYVYRNDKGEISIPGEYLRMAIIGAAKYRQDPRSPRKSAMDLYKAAVVSMTELASLGVKDWDYEDRRRVVVQRNAITRVRPALHAGWKANFELQVISPEYVDFLGLRDTIEMAGRLIGLADFRPTYGRYGVVAYNVVPLK